MLAHADLPYDAAQVDDQKLHEVEDDRRGVFHADHQLAFVVQLRAACGVESHGRVEVVVVAFAVRVAHGRAGLQPRRIIAVGEGPGDEQRLRMAAAERVGQLLPERSRLVVEPGLGESRFPVMSRHGRFGEQDELRSGGDFRQQVDDVALLPLRAAVEFVVTVHVGLDDAHLGRPFGGLLPAPPDAQRYGGRDEQHAGRRGPAGRIAPCADRLEEEDIAEQHPQRTAEDARIFVPLHEPCLVRESVAQNQPRPRKLADRVPVFRGDPACDEQRVGQGLGAFFRNRVKQHEGDHVEERRSQRRRDGTHGSRVPYPPHRRDVP